MNQSPLRSLMQQYDIYSIYPLNIFYLNYFLSRCILTQSPSAPSNWVSRVTAADTASEANCLAVSIRDSLYLVTTESLPAGARLRYFSKEDPQTEFWTTWTQAWANQRRCSRCSVQGQFETVADYRVHIALWHDLSFQVREMKISIFVSCINIACRIPG